MTALTGDGETEREQDEQFRLPATDSSSEPSSLDRVRSSLDQGPFLQLVSLANLRSQNIPPQAFAIEPLIPSGAVTLMGGHGGTGKSTLALTFAAHVACGKEWSGFRVKSGRAIYLSLEDDKDTIKRRLLRIIEASELDEKLVLANLVILDGASCECELVKVVGKGSRAKVTSTTVMDELEAYASGSCLVVIDNASEIHGIDENSRADVSGFVRILSKLARGNGAAVFLLAHVDKAGVRDGARGNAYSGSTAWHNSVRSRLALIADSHGALQLVQEKLNFGKPHASIHLEQTSHGVLMASSVQPSSRTVMTVEQRQAQESRDEVLVLGALQEATRSGRSISTASTGSENTFLSLETFSQIDREFSVRGGRKRFKSAISRLEQDGRIRRETYQGPQRKPKERWAICAAEEIDDTGSALVAQVASLPPYPP